MSETGRDVDNYGNCSNCGGIHYGTRWRCVYRGDQSCANTAEKSGTYAQIAADVPTAETVSATSTTEMTPAMTSTTAFPEAIDEEKLVAPKPQEERSDEHQARKQYKGRASYEFMSQGEFQCDGFRVTVAGHTIAECEDSEVADWICQQWNRRSAALHESTGESSE